MQKSLLVWMCVFLVVPILGLATPSVNLNSNSFTFESPILSSTTQYLYISNNGTEPIYNLTINNVPELQLNPVQVLNVGETQSYPLVVTPITANVVTKVGVLSFFYYSGVGGSQPTTRTVIYNDVTGFSPSILELFVGDVVTWQNDGTTPIQVKSLTGEFDMSVAVGGSVTYTSSSVGDILYYDPATGHAATLQTTQGSGSGNYVHSNDYDVPITFTIIGQDQQSDLDLTLLLTEFELYPEQTKQNSVLIKNNGQNRIDNIHLLGDWVEWDGNYFNLDPGEERLEVFEIEVPRTATKNKTYNQILNVVGDQESTAKTLIVKVLGTNTGTSYNGSIVIMNQTLSVEQTLRVCTTVPHLYPECEKLLVEKIIVKEVNGTHTIGDEQLLQMLDQLKMEGDSEIRQENRMNEIVDKQKNLSDSISRLSGDIAQKNQKLTEIQNQQEEDKRKEKAKTVFVWAFFILLIIGIVVAYAYYDTKQRLRSQVKIDSSVKSVLKGGAT